MSGGEYKGPKDAKQERLNQGEPNKGDAKSDDQTADQTLSLRGEFWRRSLYGWVERAERGFRGGWYEHRQTGLVQGTIAPRFVGLCVKGDGGTGNGHGGNSGMTDGDGGGVFTQSGEENNNKKSRKNVHSKVFKCYLLTHPFGTSCQ